MFITEEQKRLHRCAFTGHRPERLTADKGVVCRFLRNEALAAYADGMNVFVSGMSRGVDMWAAAIILDLRRECKDIRLICAVPCKNYDQRWEENDRAEFSHILGEADVVRYLSDSYTSGCCQRRNIWMIDHSSRLVAVWDGLPSGTGSTIRYACQRGVDTIVYTYNKCPRYKL